MRYHQIFRFVSTNHQMDVHFLKTLTGIQWSPSNTRITRSPQLASQVSWFIGPFLSGKYLYKSCPLNLWKIKKRLPWLFVLGWRPWYCCFNSVFNYAWDLPIRCSTIDLEYLTLPGINISHLGKRKIIFKMPFLGDMLVPWRVYSNITDFLKACVYTVFFRRLSTGRFKMAPLPRILFTGFLLPPTKAVQTLWRNRWSSSPLGVQFHRGMGGICFVCFSDFHQYGPCHLSIFFRRMIFRLYECHSCFGEGFFC